MHERNFLTSSTMKVMQN